MTTSTTSTATERTNSRVRFPATYRRRFGNLPDARLLVSEESRTSLAAMTGITDRSVLNDLLRAGVNENTFNAFLLLPLLEVAWANGKVDERERRIIKRAAVSLGIKPESSSAALLEFWLDARPPHLVSEAWYAVATLLGKRLQDPAEFTQVIVGAHREIADARVASGSVSRIGAVAETAWLADIRSVLRGDDVQN